MVGLLFTFYFQKLNKVVLSCGCGGILGCGVVGAATQNRSQDWFSNSDPYKVATVVMQKRAKSLGVPLFPI